VAPLGGVGEVAVPGGGGGGGAIIVALVVAESLAGKLSVTINVIVKVPAAAYACDAVAELEVVSAVPSPQLQTYPVMVPLASVDPAPLTDNVEPD
jgi:hypothetical protein